MVFDVTWGMGGFGRNASDHPSGRIRFDRVLFLVGQSSKGREELQCRSQDLTLPPTNMAPVGRYLEDEAPFEGTISLSVAMWEGGQL